MGGLRVVMIFIVWYLLTTVDYAKATTTTTAITPVTLTATDNSINQTVTHIYVVMFPLEPFVYYTTDSTVRGLIATIFVIAKNKCREYKFHETYIDLETRASFVETIHYAEKNPLGKGRLANITENDEVIWAPYVYNLRVTNTSFWMDRGIEHVGLLTSNEIVIVLPRNSIYLPLKIVRGIRNSFVVILFGALIALFVGLLFWIVERPFNDQLDHPVTGPFNAIYWSFVTMTTVGYGDITPNTSIGKIISILWMILGLVIASVVTATISQFVSGTEGLEIAGQRVAVLENSYEHSLIDHDYKGKGVPYMDYEEAIKALRRGDVFAAALPYEVAAQMAESIINLKGENTLSIVYALSGRVKFGAFLSNGFSKTNLGKCMFSDTNVEDSKTFYDKHIKFETVYYGELIEELTDAIAFHVLYGMIGVAVFIGVTLAYFFPKCKQKKKNKAEVGQYVSVAQKIDDKIGELSKLIDKLNYIKNNDNNKMNNRNNDNNTNNNSNNKIINYKNIDNKKIRNQGTEFIH